MRRNVHPRLTHLRWALLALLLAVSPAYCWERDDRLAIMASDLLPAILAAQDSFSAYYFPAAAKKATSPILSVNVVYRKKRYLAERAVKRINELKPVKGAQLQARVVSLNSFIAEREKASLAPQITFVIEGMGKQLSSLLSHAQQDLTYSSSIKDVEAGVAVGISVTERVLPAVNIPVISTMKIKFSPLFMRIAKRVE